MDKTKFEDIVKQSATSTPRILSVLVIGFEVLVTYASASKKTKNTAHLSFDESGKFLSSHGTFISANAPKFLVDNILEGIRKASGK